MLTLFGVFGTKKKLEIDFNDPHVRNNVESITFKDNEVFVKTADESLSYCDPDLYSRVKKVKSYLKNIEKNNGKSRN